MGGTHKKLHTRGKLALLLSSHKSSLPRRESGSFSSVAPARSPSSLQAQQKKRSVCPFSPLVLTTVCEGPGVPSHTHLRLSICARKIGHHTHTQPSSASSSLAKRFAFKVLAQETSRRKKNPSNLTHWHHTRASWFFSPGRRRRLGSSTCSAREHGSGPALLALCSCCCCCCCWLSSASVVGAAAFGRSAFHSRELFSYD